MQKKNMSKVSKDNFGLSQGQDESHFLDFNQSQSDPITTPPQNYSRSKIQTKNHVPQSSKGLINSFQFGEPIAHSNQTYGQNIKSGLKHGNSSDQNSRIISSESVVINFESTNEPSTSQSGDSCRILSSDRLIQEQCRLDISVAEPLGDNNNQNLSPENGEGNSNGQNSGIVIGNSNNSVAENNEGIPTESPNLRPSSGNNAVDKFFNRYIPFVAFLLLKAIYDHREGILIFVGLLVTFIHANSVIKREVAKQGRRSLLSLGIVFVNLLVSICLIYFIFQDQHLYRNLIFIPPYSQPITVWEVLWIVGITDFVLKFITIQLKVGMACFPAKLLPYSSRGKWYLMLESTSQLYRGLTPIQPWCYYWMDVYQGAENTVGMVFLIAYIISKGSDITSKFKLFLKAFWKLLYNTSLGVRPTKEQMVTAGSQCPICHDEYDAPIMLQCRHIFCESCVSVWFDREQTCPLCRAKIADDPSWRDGATSLFTQLF